MLRILFFLVMLLPSAQARAQTAEKRVALIIGNDAYARIAPLEKATGDARTIAEALVQVGFAPGDIQLVTDADQLAMDEAIAEFVSRARGADVALLFYSGHAVELDGANHLLPIDVPKVSFSPAGETLLRSRGVSFNWLMAELAAANPRSTLVILDACRDNPFVDAAGRSLGGRRGIADVQPPEGVFIAYSAGARQQALDRLSDTDADPNSVFTRVFLKHLRTPGLSIREMVLKTRPEVRELARTKSAYGPHEQFPAYYDQLSRDVVLRPKVEEPSPPSFDPRQLDIALWDEIKDSQDPEDFQDYLARFGEQGTFARQARRRVAALSAPRPVQPAPPVQPAVGIYGDGARKAGDVFRDCAECPEMVVVPAGSFMMGSPESEDGRFPDEGPQHQVTISRPFAVGRYEVTFEEWDTCVAEGDCGYRLDDHGWGRGRRPVINVSWDKAEGYVINVSWDKAEGYVKWLSHKTKQSYRLLSEAEWEYMARAGTKTRYWWSDEIGKGRANCDGCGSQWDKKQTAPVGSFAANAWGVFDVHGNVWEWVEDRYHDSYRGSPIDGSAWLEEGSTSRVLRGGSWIRTARRMRAAYRGGSDPSYSVDFIGFRVARVLE